MHRFAADLLTNVDLHLLCSCYYTRPYICFTEKMWSFYLKACLDNLEEARQSERAEEVIYILFETCSYWNFSARER